MEEINQTREKIWLLYEEARAAETREEFLEKMNHSLKLAQSIKDYSLQVKVQTGWAQGEILGGELQQFRNISLAVVNLLKELEDPDLEFSIFYSIGTTFAKVEDFNNSNLWLEKALHVAKKNSNHFDGIANLLAMLGYQSAQIPTESQSELLHNLRESLNYFKQGLEIVTENNLHLSKKAILLQNSGAVHMRMENKELAFDNFNLALAIAEEIDDDSLKQEILDNLRKLEELDI